jgi:hypothetical protein
VKASTLKPSFSDADLNALANAGQRLLDQPETISSGTETIADITDSSDMNEPERDEVPATPIDAATRQLLMDEAVANGDFKTWQTLWNNPQRRGDEIEHLAGCWLTLVLWTYSGPARPQSTFSQPNLSIAARAASIGLALATISCVGLPKMSAPQTHSGI